MYSGKYDKRLEIVHSSRKVVSPFIGNVFFSRRIDFCMHIYLRPYDDDEPINFADINIENAE